MTPPLAPTPPPVANLEFKARLLMVFTLLLVCGAILFVLYARGAFDSTQRLVLMAEDSEGVAVGMDLTFSGFPIGRVHRIELAETGKVRILVDITSKDAHWLRTSSVFTLIRGVVGSPAIRAYTGVLDDPQLPDGAERTVLQGDVSAEIPKVIASVRELMDNLNNLTAADGSMGASLRNLQTLTARLNGPGGALTVAMGSEQDAQKIIAMLDRTQALLAKLDSMAAKTDTQVFGDKGILPQTRDTIVQLQGLLGDSRDSLKRLDLVLQDAQAISGNAKAATADLGVLRAEVDASLRKVDGLVTEINRKWPFARSTEIPLP
ncbi:MAG: MCE family protein [Burkholderiales bacterium]|jgi:phospholipid/cholesterol/gamma-HCH transport system substrate-binding protein|nr:MCE family protein [Burkholderiales bacterium]MBL0244649.1 MCE family protein [Rhodoferax sp.]